MKIMVPIDRASEVPHLVEAGANEFYCGVVDRVWLDKYTYLATTSSRNNPRSHLSSIEELKEVILIAHSCSVRVFLAVNDVMYTEEQYPLILDLIEKAGDFGIDGFIIADVGLLLRLQELDFKKRIHISLRGTTFNSETIKFYEELGCIRINLPQHLTVEEIKDLIDKFTNSLEFEVFILNGKCANVCGFCSFHHGVNNLTHENERIFDLVCFKNFDISVDEKRSNGKFYRTLCESVRPKDRNFKSTHCGVCALWDFRDIGIRSVKIVGRGYSLEKKTKDVAYVHRCLNLLEDGRLTKDEFVDLVRQDFSQTYKSNCEQYCYNNVYYRNINDKKYIVEKEKV